MKQKSTISESTSCSPGGVGLLALGLMSCIFGPFTAIPGLLLSKRFRPFSGSALVGYFLCWFFIGFDFLALLGFLLKTAHPVH
jgi:hypothetical protein